MPLLNGLEVGVKIRELNKKTPIVYLTAWSTFDFAKSAISIGAKEYLVKPLNKDDLYSVLETFIDQKKEESSASNEKLKTVINQFSRSFFSSMKHGLIKPEILSNYFDLKENEAFEGISLIASECNLDSLKTFFEHKDFRNSRFYYFPTVDRTTIIAFLKKGSFRYYK